MLDTLHIRNFALVGDIVLPWKPGLNVLTGETGAGKSIIVDAMSLLMGERAAIASIRKGAAQAEIEALLDISHHERLKERLESLDLDFSSDEIVLRRVISAEGKSKCFVNGTVVTRNTISSIGSLLVDMHGQHEHQSLMHPRRHLTLLDDFAGLGADTAFVRELYGDLKHNATALENLVSRETSRNERVGELQEELALFDKANQKRRRRRSQIAQKLDRQLREDSQTCLRSARCAFCRGDCSAPPGEYLGRHHANPQGNRRY
jgi:DNA repair protein RecN (Recombination protein N)